MKERALQTVNNIGPKSRSYFTEWIVILKTDEICEQVVPHAFMAPVFAGREEKERYQELWTKNELEKMAGELAQNV